MGPALTECFIRPGVDDRLIEPQSRGLLQAGREGFILAAAERALLANAAAAPVAKAPFAATGRRRRRRGGAPQRLRAQLAYRLSTATYSRGGREHEQGYATTSKPQRLPPIWHVTLHTKDHTIIAVKPPCHRRDDAYRRDSKLTVSEQAGYRRVDAIRTARLVHAKEPDDACYYYSCRSLRWRRQKAPKLHATNLVLRAEGSAGTRIKVHIVS